uniref:Uncharacterized protein n=1 Tax=Rangifer tarandus platyrhynchus TaxID=3082113 RepID=A0ACB0DSR9_RANTA|nr:unnamed protein product [Rangifer tarandus platyrhynchus]
MYAAAFLPVVTGLDRQAAVLHPFGPRSAGRKLLGVAWGLSLLLASPQPLQVNLPSAAPQTITPVLVIGPYDWPYLSC